MLTWQPYNVLMPFTVTFSDFVHDRLMQVYCHNHKRFGKVLPQIAGEPMNHNQPSCVI